MKNLETNIVRKIVGFTLLIVMVLIQSTFAQDDNEEMKEPVTVNNVDLKRYAGTWYEIARIPNGFQDQCVKNVTATYSLREDGRIDVVNRCVEEDGSIDEAEGIAQVKDKETYSKLEVSFVSFFGIRPFWGDYWILGLEEDYKYVVVGDPSREYGWILSRAKMMTENELETCFEILRKQGYNPEKFEMTLQE